MTLGGWSIDQDLLDWVSNNLCKGMTILELGSGLGTSELVKRWNVYSVEENSQWVNAYHQQYVYAPIKDDWYDRTSLVSLPDNYDLLLVDGPAYGTRDVMNKHLDILKFHTSGCKIVVFDDVNRVPDRTCYSNFLKAISPISQVVETNTIRTSGGKAFAYVKIA